MTAGAGANPRDCPPRVCCRTQAVVVRFLVQVVVKDLTQQGRELLRMLHWDTTAGMSGTLLGVVDHVTYRNMNVMVRARAELLFEG